MDVFELHRDLIDDYASYTRSFIRIADRRIHEAVEHEISAGLLWPDPLLQLNPSFEPGATIDELVTDGTLHEECGRIFRIVSQAAEMLGVAPNTLRSWAVNGTLVEYRHPVNNYRLFKESEVRALMKQIQRPRPSNSRRKPR